MGNISKNSTIPSGGTIGAVYSSAMGIDVHAEVLVCCFEYFDFKTSECRKEARSFGTSCSKIREFTEWVHECAPTRIIMESTGVLWRAPYEALERVGFTSHELVLANARDVKGKKGHKTDKNDAEHLAELGRLDAVRSSFVPEKAIRDIRLVSRACIREKEEISRQKNRLSKTLNAVGTRAGTVFSDIHGKAAKAILTAWVEGANLEEVIAHKARRLKHSVEEIQDALAPLSDELRELIRIQKRQIAMSESMFEEQFALLRKMQAPYEGFIAQLMTIPHMKELTARLLFAEIGPDLSSFPSVRKFCSWAGICPGVKESAGKRSKGVGITKGGQWIKRILVEYCNGVALTKRGFLREVFQKFKERRGRNRAIIALAHKVMRIIYSMFVHHMDYIESKEEVLKVFRAKRLARVVRQAEEEHLAIRNNMVYEQTTGEVFVSS